MRAKPRPRKKARSPVTIHDVANLAGVSIITVSRVLNTPQRVSPDTLARVKHAIAQINYVPNLMAGGLRSSRSRLVVALVPTLSGQLFISSIQALTHALESNGYQLILGQIGYYESREDQLIDAIVGRRPDGIVLTGIVHSAVTRRRLMSSGIPIVETWDYTPTPIDMLVGFSHERVGAEVCEFLVSRGRRRLAVISADDPRATMRQQSFCRTAVKLGMALPHIEFVPAPASHASGRLAISNTLDRRPDLDAVFCSSDMLAMGVMTELRARTIAVPDSIAIVGFGDLEFSATLVPALTTVRIDGAQLGRTAAQFIVESAQTKTVKQRVVDIGFSIVERKSA